MACCSSVGQELGAVRKEEGSRNPNARTGFFNNCPGREKLQVSEVFVTSLTPESQRGSLPVDAMEILISI